MKKTIIAIILILSTVCTVSCGALLDDHDTSFKLTGMINKDYSNIKIKVTTATDEITLVSTFDVDYLNKETVFVNYTTESASVIEIVDGQLVFPDSDKTVRNGKFTITGNTVEAVGTDTKTVELFDMVSNKIEFKDEYLSNIMMGENSFTADVVSASKLFGHENFKADNMKVSAEFDDALKTLVFEYVDANRANIKIEYTYTK